MCISAEIIIVIEKIKQSFIWSISGIYFVLCFMSSEARILGAFCIVRLIVKDLFYTVHLEIFRHKMYLLNDPQSILS